MIASLVLLAASSTATAQQTEILRCNAPPLDAEQMSACTKLLAMPLAPGDMATILYRRALNYEASGQLDNVIADTSRAIELLNGLDRKIARMAFLRNREYQLRAKAYVAKGQDGLADADIEQLVALNANLNAKQSDAATYNNRAWYYHLIGADAKALPIITKALALAPKEPAILETRAEIYEKLGRRDEAIADYRAALAGSPAMKPAKDGLARLAASP